MHRKAVHTLVAIGAALALVAVPAGSASATLKSERAGGGLFQYGVENGKVYSNFHHRTRYHTATACNSGWVNPCKQVAASKDRWAKSTVPSSWDGGNKAYWNVL